MHFLTNIVCFREAMRALLPHLRLLTLRPDDAVDVLHSFLTPDELLHVLHFQICGSLKNNIPDTLNINVVERMKSKLTESCATLIPDEAVSIDFEHLRQEDVFFWHSSSYYVQRNIITLTPKTDIYITGLEYLGSFPIVRNNNLTFNQISKSYEMQPSICLTSEAFFDVWVKISPSYYDLPCKAQTVRTKFGYHNIWESGHFVPKGQKVIFKIRLQSDVGSYNRRLWQIQDDTVNEFIQTNDSCKDFGEIVVEQCELEPDDSSNTNPVSGKAPFFIKSIRYIKSC
jgi:hypothetical protein